MKAFRERNPLMIGTLGLAVLAAGTVVALNAKNLAVFGAGPSYAAAFNEAAGLKPGEDVTVPVLTSIEDAHTQVVQPAPPESDAARPAGRGAAFFDVDNTMMVGASIFHFAKGLAARKFFSWRDLTRFTARQVRLRLRGETHGDLHRTQESALAFIAGKDVAEIVALGEEIYDEELADRIWPGTLALAQAHLDVGQRVKRRPLSALAVGE